MSTKSTVQRTADCRRCNSPDVSNLYVYRNPDGDEIAAVRRMNRPDGTKGFSYCGITCHGGSVTCDLQVPDQLPLYNADLVANNPEAPLVMVEGEKCADALSCFEDVIGVTWPCGANSVGKVDFSLLAGRTVYICPDNDKVGRAAMKKVEGELAKVGATVPGTIDISDMAIEVTGENRPKFDIADAISAGLSFKTFHEVNERFGMPTDTFDSSVAEEPIAGPPAVRSNPVLETVSELYGVRPELRGKYILDERGLRMVGEDKPDLFLSSPIVVLGRTRSGPDGKAWGYLLAFRTPIGLWRTIDVPAELIANTGAELRARLQKAGVTISQGKEARQNFNVFISSTAPDRIIRIVDTCGWHDGIFVMRDQMISATNEVTLLPSEDIAGKLTSTMYRTGGDPDAWKEVPVLMGRTSHGIFAMSAALAGPLLKPLGLMGGGFHLFAPSSVGKTTTLIACGSIWGGGDGIGNMCSWRLSLNGPEAIAATHDDNLLCLDEIASAQRDELTKISYMMANGVGKQRANIDGSARPVASWRNVILSSGEVPFSAAASDSGKGGSAGSAVRMIDLPFKIADEDKALGTAEEARRHMDRVRDLSLRNYGFAGPQFVRFLVDEPKLFGVAKELIETFRVSLGIEDADGQIKRVSGLFGLCAAAGEIATQKGIFPWAEGAALEAARVCFRAWLEHRGSGRPMEEVNGLRQVVDFFETYGDAHFEVIVPKDEAGDPAEGWTRPGIVRERYGFRSRATEPIYYVNPEAWKRICTGFDPKYIAQLLRDQKALIHDPGRLQYSFRLPGASGPRKFYTLEPHKIVIDET